MIHVIRAALRRPWTVLVLVLASAMGAGIALDRMTRDVFPPLGIPTIYVAQPYGGMDPLQMEGYLTYRYEYHFLYITGIEHVESKSIQGASIMKLQFHPGTDMSQAMSETVAQVNRSRAFMPPGTVPPFIMRFDAGSVPVGYLVFSTDNPDRTLSQMQDQALNRVRPAFATLPGVSAPPPFGGSVRSIVVNVNPDRMQAYGLSPEKIVEAMAEANVVSPSGNMNLGDRYPIVPINAVVKNIKDLEGVPLKRTAQGVVFLRDLATVEDTSDVVTSYALANGQRTVYLPVTKRGDASTLAVVDLVRKNLPEFQKLLPEDIHVSYEFDQSPVVKSSIRDLIKESALGALLTGIMVLLFLRDWRSAVIVLINIPLSLFSAILALWITGQNIHLMTLGGLALAVGILVDMSTVTVENIHTQLDAGKPVARAVATGASEVAVPLLITLLCILAVFIPAFFMEGAARALFVPLSMAVGFSMASSFLLSTTLVPVLSVWFLRGHCARVESADSEGRLKRFYSDLLGLAVRARWPVVAMYLVAAGSAAWFAGSRVGVEIFPRSDTGQFAIRFRAPSGTRVDITEQLARRILGVVEREAGGAGNVEFTIGMVGVHNSSFPVNLVYLWNGGPEEGWLAVQVRRDAGLRVAELTERLRGALRTEMPDVRFSFEPQDIVSRVMSFGSPTPVEIAVSGPDIAVNQSYAERILEGLKSIPQLRDAQIAQTLDFPTVNVEVDRERAGLMGVRVGDVTRSLVAATTSSRFTRANFWADPNSGITYNLQIQIPEARTASIEDLKNVPISAEGGRTVLLRNLADIHEGKAVGTYERYNMARVVSITANIHDADLGTVARQIRHVLAATGPPPDARTRVDLRGQIVPLQQLIDGFGSGLVLSILAIFLILAANFQSVRLSIAVVTTLPAAIAGVLLALWITGTSINIQSAMGAIMSVGVAVANAILLVTFAERARATGTTAARGNPVLAAMEGATSRLRPILMTSIAMIAGMAPLALGLGEAGGQTAPLGRAVVGGLAAATFATLFVLPSVFAILTSTRIRSPSLDPDDPSSAYHSAYSHSP